MQTLMNLIIAISAENKQHNFSLIPESEDHDQVNQLFSDCPDKKNGDCSPLVTTQRHHMRLEAHRKEVTDIRDLLHRSR